MLRKRNSYPAAESDVDVNGAKRDRKEDDDDEEINVVDVSDSELDDVQKPQTSNKYWPFSISNPEDLKQLASVKFRDTPCRPLDLSNKSKCKPPIESNNRQTLENGTNSKVKSWPASFHIAERQSSSSSPLVLNQVRPSVIRSADVCFDHQELPDVDEHFRKSLGPQVPPSEADAKVDDHFARALGNMWWQIKKQETNSSSDLSSIEAKSSNSTRSSSSR